MDFLKEKELKLFLSFTDRESRRQLAFRTGMSYEFVWKCVARWMKCGLITKDLCLTEKGKRLRTLLLNVCDFLEEKRESA